MARTETGTSVRSCRNPAGMCDIPDKAVGQHTQRDSKIVSDTPPRFSLKGVEGWDQTRSEAFVAMFAEMGVRAVAGHNDDLVVFTIFDREAAEMFVNEMRDAGLRVQLTASKDELIDFAKS